MTNKELLDKAIVFDTGYIYDGFHDPKTKKDWIEVYQHKDMTSTIHIERRGREKGECKWSICYMKQCLNKKNKWEWEAMPSSRTDKFIERTRFDSIKQAFEFFEKYRKAHPLTENNPIMNLYNNWEKMTPEERAAIHKD